MSISLQGGLIGDGEHIKVADAPAMIKGWGKFGVHEAGQLKWESGTDAVEGLEMAVVAEDEETGRSAMFIRINSSKKFDDRPHYHTSASHTVILDGEVSYGVGDKRFTLKAGDYFRAPAKWLHTGSGSDGPVLMFVISEGHYGTAFVSSRELKKMKLVVPGEHLDPELPAHFSLKKLHFNPAAKYLGEIQTASLFMDKVTGAHAMLARIPPNKELDKELHIHTSASHQVVLSGGIKGRLETGEFTLRKGDYFRGYENMRCLGSHGDIAFPQGCDMFIMSEKKFGTVYLQ